MIRAGSDASINKTTTGRPTMAEVLIQWRGYQGNWVGRFADEHALCWHSDARIFGEMTAGDRLWLVKAGKNLAGACEEAPQAAFPVGVWPVQHVLDPVRSSARGRGFGNS